MNVSCIDCVISIRFDNRSARRSCPVQAGSLRYARACRRSVVTRKRILADALQQMPHLEALRLEVALIVWIWSALIGTSSTIFRP